MYPRTTSLSSTPVAPADLETAIQVSISSVDALGSKLVDRTTDDEDLKLSDALEALGQRQVLRSAVDRYHVKLESLQEYNSNNTIKPAAIAGMVRFLQEDQKHMGQLDEDSVSLNERKRLTLECVSSLDRTCRNIVYLLVYKDLESDALVDSAFGRIQSDEAKNFWIQNFGLHLNSVPCDFFAERLYNYFKELVNWTESTTRAISIQSVRNVVQSVIDVGGAPGTITMDEFADFTHRFRPFNRCLVKIACLCDVRGRRQPWFLPRVRVDWALVKHEPQWVLRFSNTFNAFTVEVRQVQEATAHRITINPDGTYTTTGVTNHDTLCTLLEADLPNLLKPKIYTLPNAWNHWRQIETNPSEAETPYFFYTHTKIQRVSASVDSDEQLSLTVLMQRLNDIESGLYKLEKKLLHKGFLQ